MKVTSNFIRRQSGYATSSVIPELPNPSIYVENYIGKRFKRERITQVLRQWLYSGEKSTESKGREFLYKAIYL